MPPKPDPAAQLAKLAELEERAEARGNAVAGTVLDDSASSQAHEPAEPQPRKPASPRARAAANVSRSGTQAAPYVRADGQSTRSTTLHLELDLHQELRMEAARRGVHMSQIVNDALRQWSRRQKRSG
jgi:uncharacterized protein (DUF4415 family)